MAVLLVGLAAAQGPAPSSGHTPSKSPPSPSPTPPRRLLQLRLPFPKYWPRLRRPTPLPPSAPPPRSPPPPTASPVRPAPHRPRFPSSGPRAAFSDHPAGFRPVSPRPRRLSPAAPVPAAVSRARGPRAGTSAVVDREAAGRGASSGARRGLSGRLAPPAPGPPAPSPSVSPKASPSPSSTTPPASGPSPHGPVASPPPPPSVAAVSRARGHRAGTFAVADRDACRGGGSRAQRQARLRLFRVGGDRCPRHRCSNAFLDSFFDNPARSSRYGD
ncbi:vegetative cell wall protein gp1-like [Syzygium oleosum]|uniref:vegetative cell wall protein gp1-like n=1 Tax=Syzygium oleosum TaxID=219896 RepID=UPI0024B88D34|nr:vegetative cell wall protein gp1-like [Syzygium oleosum]